MILYAHRGNVRGPQPAHANNPDYIDEAIELGFHVEVDLRTCNDDLFLGHDFSTYPVSMAWLKARQKRLLIHAKDLATLLRLQKTDWHYFCHSREPFTLTSHQVIWHHDLSLPLSGIVPLITANHLRNAQRLRCFGICSDHVEVLRRLL